jgi:epoxyqueuosine reductase
MNEKVFLHVCCGPCACFPVKWLKENNFDVTAFWFNQNIHDLEEYDNRLDSFRKMAEKTQIPTLENDEYRLNTWLAETQDGWKSNDKPARCELCYRSRLEKAAIIAKKKNFSYFSSTLLYSRYQYHDVIRKTGEEIGVRIGIRFFYEDWRKGWNEGILLSKEYGLYRQKHCGCIFSADEARQSRKK